MNDSIFSFHFKLLKQKNVTIHMRPTVVYFYIYNTHNNHTNLNILNESRISYTSDYLQHTSTPCLILTSTKWIVGSVGTSFKSLTVDSTSCLGLGSMSSSQAWGHRVCSASTYVPCIRLGGGTRLKHKY